VLTVAKIAASGAAAYGQYLEGRTIALAAGDYYLSQAGERVEAPGRWALGEQGAEVLGVAASRPVAAEDFRAVMAVRNPGTGGQLRAGGAGGEAVAAIDATFSAPKSVSAVWALGSPELRAALESAQERAVDAALAHATEYVPMVRRRVDRSTVLRETPAELLATSWRHTTARAVAGRPPDPQLHSHVVLHGAVRRGDGKVVAIESRAWLVHQRELGAAYRAQLAAELGALGFQVQVGTGRGGRYFELAGVPQGLLEQWSGRHHQVRAAIDQRLAERLSELRARVDAGGPGAGAAATRLGALERSGQLMPGEQRAIAMTTRAGKGQLLTAGDLDQAWWQAAQGHDFDARSVAALRARGPALELGEPELERRILGWLTEFDATFAPRQARAVALEAGVISGDPARALAALDRLHERREILDLADGRQTTRLHRGVERVAVAAAEQLADGQAVAVPDQLVDAEVAALQAELGRVHARLAAEQQRAVRVACSERRLVVIVGQAGTGKSTALTGVARAHQAAGQQLIVTSTGAQAAERLTAELSEAGVAAAGYSTRALEAAVARGAVTLGPDVTVVHDEAALASTREQAWLLRAAAGAGARVIEVGDPRQSGAVGAGGLWPQIEQAAGDHGGLVELARIVRARDAADRRDQARWRAGEHQQALAGYAARGRVLIEASQRQAQDRALEAAHSDRQAGKRALVVVQTSNERLDELNARAQALRAQDGLIVAGGPAVPLAGRPYELYAGDEIVLRAASVHPQLGAVRNGTRGTVLEVAEDGQHAILRLADGRQAAWEREQLDAASARLAYVSHTFPAQGQTVDRCHVIADQHADANGTYVALTRARERTHLYASAERLDSVEVDGGDKRLAGLAERLGRSEPEVPSIAVPVADEHRAAAHSVRVAVREPAAAVVEPDRVRDRDLVPGGDAGAETHREPGPGVGRELERERLSRLRARCDGLRGVLDTYPAGVAGEVARLRGQADQEREAAAGDEWRVGRWEADRRALGRLARHGPAGQSARQYAQTFAQSAQQERQRAAELDAQAQRLADGPRGPATWKRAHPDARADLYWAETELARAVAEQARERGSVPAHAFDPAVAGQELAWLGAERDRLGCELGGYPSQVEALAQAAERDATAAEQRGGQAQARARASEAQLAGLGWLARRGERGDRLRDQAAQAYQHAAREQELHRAGHERAQELRDSPGGPGAWERAHPGVRERLAVYEYAHEQAAGYHARHQLAFGAPEPVVRLLGRPPADRDQQIVWEHAGQALLAYRLAHGVKPDVGLGPPPHITKRDAHRGWEHARDQLRAARERLPEPERRGAGLAYDSRERRHALADELRLRGVGEAAIAARLAADITHARPPAEAALAPPEPGIVRARPDLSPQPHLDRGQSIGR